MYQQMKGESGKFGIWGIWILTGVSLLVFLAGISCRAETLPGDETVEYLKELSLEQLLELEVTSVSKKREKFADAAAAVFVITSEDIRRSGATTVADALRLAPGLEVARIDANKWAISSRGFNGDFANKLLVLIDGRSVYSPLYSGVFWDVQDLLLADIDRIEVIRGPGAALWGANAVNGIINIITKPAQETQGMLLTSGIGTEEHGFGSGRYGLQIGKNTYARAYIKYFKRDEGEGSSGQDAHDDWDILRGGFRLDWKPSEKNSLTVQGDLYGGEAGVTRPVVLLTSPYQAFLEQDADIAGGNLLARWTHTFTKSSDMAIQLYYDRTERDDPLLNENRDTFDIDFQHRFMWGNRQEIIWGMEYRLTTDNLISTEMVRFDPTHMDWSLYSAFVQDRFTIIEDRLWLTIGSKFEYHDFTGLEIQPSGRVLWKFHDDHTIWAAISRSARTPSRTENSFCFQRAVIPPGTSENPSSFPMLVTIKGNSDFDSEYLVAYELGYRFQMADAVFWDAALFFHDYHNLISTITGSPSVEMTPIPHILVQQYLLNENEAESAGVEITATWWPRNDWQLQAAYTYFDIHTKIASNILNSSSPKHQLSLRSSLNLPHALEFDAWFRYVDERASLGVADYTTLDVRLGWKPTDHLELALVGQHLLSEHDLEFSPIDFPTVPTEVERSLYAGITWRF